MDKLPFPDIPSPDCSITIDGQFAQEINNEIDGLRKALLEIRRRLVEWPGVTCGMNDVIDHVLGDPPTSLNESGNDD